jgi:tetratricopeptide (TPR) repeat protein
MRRSIFILLTILPFLLKAQEEISLPQPPAPVDYSQAKSNDPVDLLNRANQHYTDQEYAQAITLYEQILASGKESAQLYFNLGNACFKNNETARALLNYERAKMLAPANEDIDFNIRIANQFTVDNIQALPQPFFVRWRAAVVDLASADHWAMMSIAAFLLFLIFLGTFLFSRMAWVKRITFWSGLVLLVFSGFSFSFASRQKNAIDERNHAIIFCPRVTVKSSPSTTGTDLFLIHEGLKVEITDSLNNWKEIRIPDGNKGWMPDSCAVRI